MRCNSCYMLMAMLLAAAPAAAQPIRLPQVARAPTLDDYVRGETPQGELVRDEFRQRDPNDGDPASQSTSAFVSFDRDNLYVAFVCRDRDPSRIRARLSKRDAITQDDQVIVMLDTFHDRRRSYLFAVNPLGVQADAMSSEGRDDDYSFDAVWRANGRLIDGGFAVLMTIPFKSLRISADSGGTWGIALSRVIPRNSEQSFWPAITRRVEGMTQQFATIERPERVSGGRNVQLIPYAAISDGRYLNAADSTFASPTDTRAGLDAKVVIRDAVAVDLAINPDFSQVESDQPQVAVNQRFELFYPEKRPFFLESASVFKYVRTAPSDPTTRNVPEMLFFSRRIQNPQFGTRVTGKTGPWSFGSIFADDRGFAGGDRAAIAIGRVQREFGSQSTVGVFVTSRDRGVDVNRAAAIDVRLKLSPNWVFAGQAVASRTARSDGSSTSGPAYNASLFYSSRRILYSAFYSDRSPGFRAALGFVPRVDIRQIEQYTEYRWRPRTGPVIAFGPNSYFRLNWNRRGDLQEWIVRYPFEVFLKGRTQIFMRHVQSNELFERVNLRGHIQTIDVTTEWIKWLAITEGLEWGVKPNYFPPPGLAPHMGESLDVRLGLTFRPTPRLRQDVTYLRSSLRTPSGARIFTNNIARSTFNYQFTRELSVRAIVDYNTVARDAARVRLINDERLGADLLFTYQLGPSTALYVGYTSGYQNLSPVEPGMPAARIDDPKTQVGRQLLMKVSYLWRR
ncbi:MAG TPA: DUF5916 domain-containing protein [Vicinamibacterales bacterium]|nr:DUF5916 domain-containing protein [Vicinamibacterales bacterium]